jgi:PAS domain S-box-containing protein
MIISTQFKKGVKQKLDELMKLFDLIITSSYDGIYVCDKNGNTLLVNESLLKITNLSKEVLFSYNVFELVKKILFQIHAQLKRLNRKRYIIPSSIITTEKKRYLPPLPYSMSQVNYCLL